MNNMSRKEAIEILKKEKNYMLSHGGDTQAKALNMAIASLEADEAEKPEFCEDCVSRKAIVEMLTDIEIAVYMGEGFNYDEWRDKLEELPSVLLKTKKGHWLGVSYDGYADGNPVYDLWECSECGYEHSGEDNTLTDYCPGCGVNMVEVVENKTEDNN